MQSSAKIIDANHADAAIRSARILIAADEFTTRKGMRTLLLSMGAIDVHEAPDGASALAAISLHDADVVILDWQLAGMGGPEFVRRLRAPGQFPRPNVPIIMLTSHGEPAHVIEAMRLGVHEFLVKPVSDRALYERIASALVKAAVPRRAASRPTGAAVARSRAVAAGLGGASLGSTRRSRI